MSKKILIIGTVAIVVIAGLVIGINALIQRNTPNPDLVIHFCERNPDALVCVEENEDATNEDFANDMFHTLIETYAEGYSEDFCNDYFTGYVQIYCVESIDEVMPQSTDLLSMNYEMTEISEGIYDIETYYKSNDDPALTFRIAIVERDSVYVFSGISYYVTPPIESLDLQETDITTFMDLVITESVLGDPDYCVTYFVDDALTHCQTDVLNVAPQEDLTFNTVITFVETNTFTYSVTDELESVTYTYTIYFVEYEGSIYISELSVEEVTTE